MSSYFKYLKNKNNSYVMELLIRISGLALLVETKNTERLQNIMDCKDELITDEVLTNFLMLISDLTAYGLDNIDKLYIDLSEIDLDPEIRKDIELNNIKKYNQLITLYSVYNRDEDKYLKTLYTINKAINNTDDSPNIYNCIGCIYDTLEERTCPDSYCKDCVRNSGRTDYYESEIKKEDN